MSSHAELAARAAAAYNASADYYDAPENAFWERFGRRTVARLGLRPGDRVLDACAGSGASALAAAETVGPAGRVVAVDIAEHLLALLREKAVARGLRHVDARTVDVVELGSLNETYDAVICVFGIFFAADMRHALRVLWDRVADGGQLAVTTWGPRLFEPANTVFWDAVRSERPELYKGFNPWDEVTDPSALRRLMQDAGIPDAEIAGEDGTHPIPSPSAWWSLVMGSGYRGTLEQLPADGRERVKVRNLAWLEQTGTREVEANVIYAAARKGT